jgi:hypothetical protein
MKILAITGLLLAGLSVSACWDDDQKKKSTEFMSNLTKCDNCDIDKPFLGAKKDDALLLGGKKDDAHGP